jgi:hypothetical protein
MKKIIALLAVLAVPAIVSAQALTPITNVNNLSSRIIGIGNIVAYLLVSLAVLYIIWNVVQYMIKPNGEERSAAAANIGWGIFGLFIIVSIWGLVNILTNTFKTTPTQQAIPNLSNVTVGGGIPANQVPFTN